MLIGYEIWNDRTDKPMGYATVNQTADGELVDIEIVNCNVPNANPNYWIATAWKLINEHKLAGVVFYHEGSTVTISECTPF